MGRLMKRSRCVLSAAIVGSAALLAAQPARAQQFGTNLLSKGILAIRAPGQLDVAIIDAIAQVGVKQVVTFSTTKELVEFIARKCGRASLTVTIHPRYREKLIAANNTGATADSDPLALTGPRTLTLPACADTFAIHEAEYDVPDGVEGLARKLAIPFDPVRFQKLANGPNPAARIAAEYDKLAASPYPDGQACKASDLVSFFACVNAIEIAYVNRERIRDADRFVGRAKIPVAPLERVQARVPIAAETAGQLEKLVSLKSEDEKKEYKSSVGISNLTPIVPPAAAAAAQVVQTINGVFGIKIAVPAPTVAPVPAPAPAPTTAVSLPTVTPASSRFLPPAAVPTPAAATAVVPGIVEGELKFVRAIGDVTRFDPGCSDADRMNKGHWPFDANELMRVLALSYNLVGDQLSIPRVLVVDTGFDFTGDNGQVVPVPEKYIFPKDSFSLNRDKTNNGADGIAIDHSNFAGVNLAMSRPSAATHTLDTTPLRSHGLAVTALALGGRDLQYLRTLRVLKTKVGIASLVPTNDVKVVLNQTHLQNIMTYAAAQANDFRIINLSLSTRDKLQGFQSQLKQSSSRVFVAAAGNDDVEGKALQDSDTALYPAALGGAPSTTNLSDSVVITVGAHKGDGKWAKFSYYSPDQVDLLAPGCMVPSYELRKDGAGFADPPRAVESSVSGTSFAAPLVSFLASVLMSDASLTEPGIVKERAILGTDFDWDLRERAYSSGRLNAAKMLSATFDVLETVVEGHRQIRFGNVKNKNTMPSISCNGVDVPFGDIRKLAFDVTNKKVMMLSNHDPSNPGKIKKNFCDPSVLAGLTYKFDDAETGETDIPFDAATQVVDYVATLRK